MIDVERAIAERDAVAARADAVGEVVPLTGLRKIIADRMTMSVSTMAQVTLTTEADVTELLNLRESLVSEWRPHRIRPLDQDLIIGAVAGALKAHPRLNSHLVDGNVLLLKEVNIGVAVAVRTVLLCRCSEEPTRWICWALLGRFARSQTRPERTRLASMT